MIFMVDYIGKYIEASGAEPGIRTQFNDLMRKMPELASDPRQAAIAIKKAVYDNGFDYQDSVFRIQDVLRMKRGNCLGLPLLMGVILGEMGINPEFRLDVGIRDDTYKHEKLKFEILCETLHYDPPEFKTERDLIRECNNYPLEHLLLGREGFEIETTSRYQHGPSPSESQKFINFDEAIAHVYRDRLILARDTTGRISDDGEKYGRLLVKTIESIPKDRTTLAITSDIARSVFSDESHAEVLKRIEDAGGNDSLYYYQLAALKSRSGRPHEEVMRDLEEALSRYPSFSSAIENKAYSLIDDDPRESKYLFSLASHLFAGSKYLDLIDFYIANHVQLARHLGKHSVLDTILRLDENARGDISVTERSGTFPYHLAIYNLDGNVDDIEDARNLAVTPIERLEFLVSTMDSEFHDEKELFELDEEHKKSELYKRAKQDEIEKKKSLSISSD
jgi:hypothetical protein